MSSKFDELHKLGVGEFEHLNGSLISHLSNTYALLKQWGASQALCDAGLYHAAYGTDGFDAQVVSLTDRNNIARIIGEAAEQVVYLYCSCDRDYAFGAFDARYPINFKDRFNGKEFTLTDLQARQFCELTVANELELAIDSQEFLIKHGKGLLSLLTKMSPLISEPARQRVDEVLCVQF